MKKLSVGLWAVVTSFVLLVSVSCATGTVQTASGPRPAAEVQVQDTVGDLLNSLQAAYTASVAAHDARVATEDPVLHAAHRATLLTYHDALAASWQALLVSKQVAGTTDLVAIVTPLVAALPDFCALAVDLGAMTPDAAAKVIALVKTYFPAAAYLVPSHPQDTPATSSVNRFYWRVA
jgi:hypothetical protein